MSSDARRFVIALLTVLFITAWSMGLIDRLLSGDLFLACEPGGFSFNELGIVHFYNECTNGQVVVTRWYLEPGPTEQAAIARIRTLARNTSEYCEQYAESAYSLHALITSRWGSVLVSPRHGSEKLVELPRNVSVTLLAQVVPYLHEIWALILTDAGVCGWIELDKLETPGDIVNLPTIRME